MRLLAVSNVPLQPVAGSAYVILGYAERLRARGHEVVTLEPREYLPFPRVRAAHRLRMLLGYTRATLRTLQRERFDVIELWGAESWRVARQLGPRRDRPLLVGRSNGLETHCREVFARHGARGPGLAGRWFDRWQSIECAFRAVDALTTVSDFDARYAETHRYQPAGRLLALNNPLRDDWLAQPPALERPRVLAYFGSWLPQKGAEVLPAIFTAALRRRPDWRGRIVGPPPAAAAAQFPADIRERIEFVPFTSDTNQLRELYRASAVTLMPSLYESFGLVAAEALACGCALVASPVGFPASLRDGEEAVLVADRNVAAWTAAVGALLDDEALRRRLGAAGRARVQSLRWSDAVDRLEGFYAHLLSARRAPPSR